MLTLLGTAAAAFLLGQAPGQPELDGRLMDYYARQVALLRDADSYTVQVRLDWKTEGAGEGESGTNLYRFAYRKPGRFRIEVRPGGAKEGEDQGPTLIVVSDGKTVTTVYPARSLYSERPMVDLKDALGENAIVAMSLDGSLLDTLLRTDLVDIVRGHASRTQHEGQEQADGQTLDRFTLRWRGDEEELLFGPADEPLPRKLVRVVRVAVPGQKPMKLITTATLTWTMGADVPDSTFRVELPKDARKVDDIYAALVRGSSADLLGQPAPAVRLKRAGGGADITLEAHRGEDVVVLDFWASWCAPCVASMPQLANIAEAYKGKAVAFYAVNVGEEPEEVERFLRSGKLTLPSALDPDGEATERFGVTAIPALVVVGKDGTVQAEYSGTESLESALTRDLDALLRGKTLAPKRDEGKSTDPLP